MKSYKIIESVTNPDVKLAASLALRKNREKHGLFVAEGVRTVTTIIECGWQPVMLFVTAEHIATVESLDIDPNVVRFVPESIINKISQTQSPSGIATLFRIPATPNIKNLSDGIVLADIRDPGNMGTLIRSCIAFGKKTIVVVGGADVWNPKVIQACAGTIAKATIFIMTWEELIKQATLPLHALVVHNGTPLSQIESLKGLLVIGNEAHGLSDAQIADCTNSVTIEMHKEVESLNAAVAGSIAMYCAWMKQKRNA